MQAIGKTIGLKLLVAVLAVALVFTMMPLCGNVYADQTSWNDDDVALKIGTTELKRADVVNLESTEITVPVGETQQIVKGVKLETLFTEYSSYFTKQKVTINTVDIGETPQAGKTQLVADRDAVKNYILAYEVNGKAIFRTSSIMTGAVGCFDLYNPDDMVKSDGTSLKTVLKMPGEFIDGGSGSGNGSGSGGGNGGADLVVSYNGSDVKFFLDNDEQSANKGQLYRKNGTEKVYVPNTPVDLYTAIKKTGSASNTKNALGPEVTAILTAAGFDEISDDSEITFTSSDGKSSSFSWEELINTARYAFPNANIPKDPETGGAAVTNEQKEGAVEVPVIINVSNGQMCFGQVSPTEQNRPGYVSGMIGATADGTPTIAVQSGVTFDKVSSPEEGAVIKAYEGVVAAGTEMDFNIPSDEDALDNLGVIYYTTDNSEPTQESAFYNWYSYNDEFKFNPPVVSEGETFTVKARAFKYGKQPSDVVEFAFKVVPEDLTANATLTLAAKSANIGGKPAFEVKVGENSLSAACYTAAYTGITNVGTGKVTVTGKAPFTGELSETFTVKANLVSNKAVITLNKTKVTAGVKPAVSKVTIGKATINKKYYSATVPSTKKVGKYKVTVKGKDLVSGTITKQFTVIPAKAKISKAKAGKKKATITIKSQKASGVTKYQIAYKLKTAKKWKTTTTKSTKKVIKKLKKGKKYNFKVRAYGKTGYGAYSAVKTIKIK